jgi:excisionase family DNA binding protein
MNVANDDPESKGQPSPSDGPAPRQTKSLGRVLDRLDALNEKIDALRAERDPDRLLTRQEAAERLRISVRTLDTLRAAGELRAVKVKRRVRFHPDALDAYVRRNAEEGRQ